MSDSKGKRLSITLPVKLYDHLRLKAEEEKRSLNGQIVYKLWATMEADKQLWERMKVPFPYEEGKEA